MNNTIEITKETIRTKNKTFTIKNIHNISYDEEVLSLFSNADSLNLDKNIQLSIVIIETKPLVKHRSQHFLIKQEYKSVLLSL